MITALSRSLSLRMLGIFIITAILIVVVLVGLFSRGLSTQWRRSIQPHLVQYAQYVQQDLGRPPDPERAEFLAKRLNVVIHIFKDEQFQYSTSGIPPKLDNIRFRNIPVSDPGDRSIAPIQSGARRPGESLRVAISTDNQPNKRILRIDQGSYSVYYDLYRQRERRDSHGKHGDELLLALAALTVVLGGSYFMIRRQLAPIGLIQRNVSRMATGELQHRINSPGRGDLDELANSIDGLAARLQAMLDAKRQLLMAISHELRSPVTRARIATELLPESRNRERLLEDLVDMERMITDIMESEQLQSNHAILNLDELDLVPLVQQELKLIAPSIKLTINGTQPDFIPANSSAESAIVQGDAVRLRILLRNLVSNALQHGKNDSGDADVEVAIKTPADAVKLLVIDRGPGIATDHLNAVTEPFYRPDISRSRTTGGFGLGLTLAKLIAEAHGGTLDIDSDPNKFPGTRITVTIPRSQAGPRT